MKKVIGLLIVIAIISLIVIFGLSGVDLSGAMISINDYFYNLLGPWGIYIGILLISIFGNFTIILPVPYILTVMTTLLVLPINPIILALFAALGASVGELTAWVLGWGTSEMLKKKDYIDKIKGLNELIDKGFAYPLIVLYAATPLPDDILLIALGIRRYSLKKSLVAAFIGKLLMVFSLLFAVFLAENTFIGQLVLYLFGLDVSNGTVKSTGNTIVTTITLLVTTAITVLIVMVDWRSVGKRIKKAFNYKR